MRHDIRREGPAFRLRPVADDDAAYIVDLRARAGPYINRGATTVAEQRDWLARYYERHGDYYFVVEVRRDRGREGLVGVYDADGGMAEWGRFVLEPGSIAAVETALLVYDVAFDDLGLERLRCRTLAANARVVAFHDSCGLVRMPGEVTITHDGVPARAIEHWMTRDAWPGARERMARLAARIAETRSRASPKATT
ncbi:MAG TPA: GNAT family N-acetyltransferase [Casimicrobiaceae bacterium]|nr:GNAT family N-acetyltransferase [Casimicrobiaceae bacterium]